MSKSLFKIILKTKDEDFLLEPWIQYHIKLVGKENVIIYDNNSVSEIVKNLYKKYDVEVRKIDTIKGFHSNKTMFKEMEDICDFFTIIDTDEYLTYFDFIEGNFNNEKFLQLLFEKRGELAIPMPWVTNLYDGFDHESPLTVNEFDFSFPKSQILTGKYISSSKRNVNGIVGHNGCIGLDLPRNCYYNMTVSPEIFCLHISRSNWESRIKSKLNDFHRENANWSIESTLEEISLKNANGLKLNHIEYEIWGYLKNRDEFLKKHNTKKTSLNKKLPILQSNIISSFIKNEICQTQILNSFPNTREIVINNFIKAFENHERVKIIQ